MALTVAIKKKLGDFSLEVSFKSHQCCMGILGASGCGKSMTLKCIAGIETPDEGYIELNGKVFFDSEKKINLKPQERGVGYLFQNYALFPTMTVEENIACVLYKYKENKKAFIAQQMKDYHLEGLEKKYPAQLSGGQQQRVAMARMMALKPKLIMLDEPFSALDSFLREALQKQLLEMLRTFPGEVLIVSHSRDEIYKLCDQMTIIDRGKALITGEKSEIFENPIYQEVCQLTGCKNFSTIEKCGDFQVFAKDWNIYLNTKAKVSDEIRYVAIRGHKIIATEGLDHENTMQIQLETVVDAPFEYQYVVRNITGGQSFWWMVPKNNETRQPEDNFCKYICLPKDQLMLLK